MKSIDLLVTDLQMIKVGPLFVQNISYEEWCKYSRLKIYSLEWNFGSQIWWKFQWTFKSKFLAENSKIREHFRYNYYFLIKIPSKKLQCGTESTPMLHFCFLCFILGGLLFLIFCSVLISGPLQVNFIPKELGKVFKN